MALKNLKQNLEIESEIMKDIFALASQFRNLDKLYPAAREGEKKLILNALNSLFQQLKIINNSIPSLVNSISLFRQLREKEEKVSNLIQLSYSDKNKKEKDATIEKKDDEKFLQEIRLSKESFTKLRKIGGKEDGFRTSYYVKISNFFFQNLSSNLIKKDYFLQLTNDLRKANLPYLSVSYVSMAFFTTMLSFILGIFLFLFLSLFELSYNFPFIEKISLNLAIRNIFIVFILPLATYLSFYFYPSAEKSSIGSKINEEMPFVAIHMSAVASSNIEPSKIFKIIAAGEDYPYTKKEFKKIITQINLYGFDLLSALKNTAKETSSKKLSELLNGMASAISGGTSMKEFLEKRAETLMFDYKLEREKYNKVAETFLDIYISIMITAPMILTLLLVLMSISNISIGLNPTIMAILIILIVSAINIIFLIILHLKQPSY